MATKTETRRLVNAWIDPDDGESLPVVDHIRSRLVAQRHRVSQVPVPLVVNVCRRGPRSRCRPHRVQYTMDPAESVTCVHR